MKNKPAESVQKILRCPPALGLALSQALLLGLAGTAALAALGAPIPMAMIEPWLGLTIAILSLATLFFSTCAQAELLRRTLKKLSQRYVKRSSRFSWARTCDEVYGMCLLSAFHNVTLSALNSFAAGETFG